MHPLNESIVEEVALIWFGELGCQAEIPSLLHYNELLVVSDGVQARIGSLTASQEWFAVGSILEPTARIAQKEVCP